jgi:RHS repeat-associated protein
LYRRASTTQPDPDAGGALDPPVTSFAYDAAGNMTSLTDPVANVTSWVYDAHNRVIEETNELSDTRYFEYDVAGNLVEKTDRNGLVTQFTYDNLYRLTQEVWLDGVNTVNTLDFTYDDASQMLTAADDVSSYAYTYNGLGQVTLIEIDNGGPLVELVQEFTPVGSRSLLAASFDDGGGMDDDFQNIFYFDNLQRMVQIDQSGVQGGNTVAEKRVNFAYNAAGQFTAINRYKDLDGGSGNLVATTAIDYDDIGRLTDLTHTHDTTTIADYDWTFDAFSRVTSMSFTALVGDDGSSAYTYDDTNQVTGADHDFQTDETYEYDENGNRTMSGYVVDDNNLTTSDGTHDYEYDDEGNRTKNTHSSSGDYVTYEWDHRNRLTGVEFRTSAHALTKRVEYEYDLFNRRISKRVDDDGDTNFDWAQRFVYDGEDVVLVFDDTGSLTNRYLHGPAVDQILADEDALGEVLWPLADNLGTVRDLVDNDGDVVNHLTYNSFGAITSQTAPSLEPLYTYTGREWDADVELYFYRARWYDPILGQFISQDPIGFLGGDSNVRRYVANAPVNGSDPSGLYSPSSGALLSEHDFEKFNEFKESWLGSFLFDLQTDISILIPAGAFSGPAKSGTNLGAKALKDTPLGKWVIKHMAARAAKEAADTGCSVATRKVTAYVIAREGGRHAGFLKNYLGKSAAELQKAIKSLEANAAKHAEMAANPSAHAADWASRSPQARQGLINYWLKEAQRYFEQAEVLRGILQSRQ